MSTKEQNTLIAEFMESPEVLNYHECWNSLMAVANRLKLASRYYSVSFTDNQLNFDIDVVHENCVDYIKLIHNMS
jgi:hypothetical protein